MGHRAGQRLDPSQDRRKGVAQCSEREANLGFGRPRDEDEAAGRRESLETGRPDRRLAEPGLTADEERPGPVLEARAERLERGELAIATDDPGGQGLPPACVPAA
jgi:hypothetical protein